MTRLHSPGAAPDATPVVALPAGTPAPPLVSADGIRVMRGGRVVLDDVSLTVRAGEIVALVGASGAGKSALLLALSGLLPLAGGRIEAGGAGTLSSAARWKQHRRRMASIFQDLALIEQASALHNVLVGLADRRSPLGLMRGWRKAEIMAAAALMGRFGISHLAHSRVDRLSGGERRRVAVARAMIRDASLLLADEPFNSLDPELARGLVRCFADEAMAGTGMIVALHQAELLPLLAHRVIALERGRVVFDCPAADIGRRDLAPLFASSPRPGNHLTNVNREAPDEQLRTPSLPVQFRDRA